MANPNEQSDQEKPTPSPPADSAVDVEAGGGSVGGAGVANIVRRWKREDLIKRGSLALRGLGLIFSVLAFLIMVTNRHGDGRNFDDFEEYRYLVAISILSLLYTGFQSFRHFHETSTGREMFSRQNVALVDFFGDQIVAYLLISAASSAVPVTDRMREGADNIFTDASAAAISMEFFAFFSLALSALISGYELSKQTYI